MITRWVKCGDEMPKTGVLVLAYVSRYGRSSLPRRFLAAWCEGGWCEQNEYGENLYPVTGDVTHWMPLSPEPSDPEDPDEMERLAVGNDRYETARLLSPEAWQEAWQLNIATGKPFDEIIDDLRPFVRTRGTRA